MNMETLFQIEFWLLIGLVLLMRVFFIVQLRRAGERFMPDQAAVQREGRGIFLFRVFGFFFLLFIMGSILLGAPWVRALGLPLPDWLREAGFVLGLFSLALWTWSQTALGTRWSANLMLRKGHTLITTGPYARIRHPLYTAMTGWSAGLALVSANWIFIVVAAVVTSVFFLRVPREEQMLLTQFGEEYREYMQRTGRFFPRL